ncbi:MAG: isoquinoline 1-oxidoreductase [Blastocatellia bacterium AA13]|nr:MAG: isoquinoline 1-oxidoreductase [Blastocatellia bacterium AA13]
MTDEIIEELELEPERYELHAGPLLHFDLDRRDFFKVTGGGIFVLLALKGSLAQESGGGQRRGQGGAMPKEIGAWIHVAEDGSVTVYTGKVEVGQNIRTSLSQVVAEELRIPLTSVKMVMGDTDIVPYDAGTFGSLTTRMMSPQLRKAGAAAREALIDLAAEAAKVDRKELTVAGGKVIHAASKRSFEFGKLTHGQRVARVISDDVGVTPPGEWKIAGKSAQKVDARAIVTGKHEYSSDIKRPGLLHAKVLRPSAYGATLVSADSREAEKLPNVTVVKDGEFIGVAAKSESAAAKARESIRAEWKTAPQPSSRELFDYLRTNAGQSQGGGRGGGRPEAATGSIEKGLAEGDHKLQQTYTVAYIAHIPLEPRAAVAEWNDGKLTVWTGTQRPFGVRSELAQAFHIPEEKVRVLVPDTGSGYGGKHTGEAAIEAARIAKAAGKPVKLVWTREEEFNWAYFRPAGVIDVNSAVTRDGKITAWEFHNYNSGQAGIRTLYEVPNQLIQFHSTKTPLRQGSYRALAATANHFARETHMDELAHAVKMDPLEFRLKNLKDDRLRAVFEAAAAKFGWGKTKPAPGRGFGIAGGFEKGGYVAMCAEVSVDRTSSAVKIERVVASFDCGPVVNPDQLRNQIEGSVVMGIGGALFEAIEFEDGKLLNGRLSSYRVPRFSDAPSIDVVLVDRKDLPTAGAGETPIVGLAPAVGNAIFNATGIRARSLPMRLEKQIAQGAKG